MKSFKITMLGGSGVGKTAFLAAAYKLLKKGVGEFSISACDPITKEYHKENHGLLESYWTSITENKRWLQATGNSVKKLSFSFEKDDTPMVYLDFIDYRGSLLHKNTSEDPEYSKLEEHLFDSEIVMCCVPGDYLTKTSKDFAEISNMIFLLRALKKKKLNSWYSRLPLVIILITKYDKCDNIEKEINKLITAEFNTLFSKGNDWFVSIMGTTLGQELNKVNEDLSKAEISPEGIKEAFAFASHYILYQLQRFHEKEATSHESTARNLGGDWFSEWYYEESISRHKYNANEHRNQAELLKKNLTSIKDAFSLDEAEVFFKGKELNFDEFSNLLTR